MLQNVVKKGFMMAAESVTAAGAGAENQSKVAAVPTTSSTILGPREQLIAKIAAFAASDKQDALKQVLTQALEQGLTVNELKDVLVQMYAYCGFPRSLTALGTLMALVNERKGQGIVDDFGREATPLPDGTNIHELGTAVQTKICGGPVGGPFFEFCPDADRYLKDHLFGDIFASDLLTHKDREIATIAALASLPAPIQLRAHYGISMNVGWTKEQLQDFVTLMQTQVSKEAGEVAARVLQELLSAKA